jgi:hypothetical protein
MNIGQLTNTGAPERKPPTALKSNQCLIQWRMKDRSPSESNRWKNHSAVDKESAASRVQTYNDHSEVFEYRIRPPQKHVDTPAPGNKVAA